MASKPKPVTCPQCHYTQERDDLTQCEMCSTSLLAAPVASEHSTGAMDASSAPHLDPQAVSSSSDDKQRYGKETKIQQQSSSDSYFEWEIAPEAWIASRMESFDASVKGSSFATIKRSEGRKLPVEDSFVNVFSNLGLVSRKGKSTAWEYFLSGCEHILTRGGTSYSVLLGLNYTGGCADRTIYALIQHADGKTDTVTLKGRETLMLSQPIRRCSPRCMHDFNILDHAAMLAQKHRDRADFNRDPPTKPTRTRLIKAKAGTKAAGKAIPTVKTQCKLGCGKEFLPGSVVAKRKHEDHCAKPPATSAVVITSASSDSDVSAESDASETESELITCKKGCGRAFKTARGELLHKCNLSKRGLPEGENIMGARALTKLARLEDVVAQHQRELAGRGQNSPADRTQNADTVHAMQQGAELALKAQLEPNKLLEAAMRTIVAVSSNSRQEDKTGAPEVVTFSNALADQLAVCMMTMPVDTRMEWVDFISLDDHDFAELLTRAQLNQRAVLKRLRAAKSVT